MSGKFIVVFLLGSLAVVHARTLYDSVEDDSSPFHEHSFSAEIPEHETYDILEKTEETDSPQTSRDMNDRTIQHILGDFKNDGEIQERPRQKRALVFRPLFVYRQQELKRKRVEEEKKQKQKMRKKATSKPIRRIIPFNQG